MKKNETNDNFDVLKALEFVRAHQVYRGEVSKQFQLNEGTISDWLADTKTGIGAMKTKAYIVYQDYLKWCEQHKKKKEEICTRRTFNTSLRLVLNYTETKDNLFFNINRKLKYEPQKSKDQAAQSEEKE